MKTLVSYAYYETDSSKYNLEYFLKKGIFRSTSVLFIITINGHQCSLVLPLIENVIINKRDNLGYDFGAHSSAIQLLGDKLYEYDYFVFLNSSVIGPFLPAYFPKDLNWTSIFINKLIGDVKLVGTTIVCLPETDEGGYGPRVEGFCFTLDRDGLQIILDKKTIFCNHESKRDAIVNGEYGLSRAILDTNYTIDCLLLKYQGLDWKNYENWNQNNNQHPSRQDSYDGISIHPLEVVFHKWYWSYDPNKLVSYDYVNRYNLWLR